jgi:hypothetical protein
MSKRILALGLLILVLAVALGWQIASAELDSVEFHDDLRGIAAQNGVNIGLNSPKTDDQIRGDVIAAAAEHGIQLQPDQVDLQRITSPHHTRFDLAVSYTTRVNLLFCSLNLHFDQTSAE